MLDPTIPGFNTPPNWAESFLERITFRTDGLESEDHTEQTRATRVTPRRSFEYALGVDAHARRLFINTLYAYGGDRRYLPIWVDGVTLTVAEPLAGDGVLEVETTVGRGFEAGGVVMVLNEANGAYELAEIESVAADAITLTEPLDAYAFPAGATVYPVRLARIDRQATWSGFNDTYAYGRVKFNIVEPNPYPAADLGPLYRGFPVLTTRPETSRDPSVTFQFMLEGIDDDVGIPTYTDTVGFPLYRQEHDWALEGREQIDAFRGMIYALQGKQKSIWVPTWDTDMVVYATLAAGGTGLQVWFAGVTLALGTNRQDIRIEMRDGTVYYRRIASAVVSSGAHETLTLDAALPVDLTAATVLQISYMGLCRSDTDNFEFHWFKGDHATVAMAWRARQHDV